MVGTFLRHKITWKQEDCKKYNQEHIFYVNPKNSIRKKDLPLPMKFIVFTIISAGPWLNFYLWLLHSIAKSSLFPTSVTFLALWYR